MLKRTFPSHSWLRWDRYSQTPLYRIKQKHVKRTSINPEAMLDDDRPVHENEYGIRFDHHTPPYY